MKNRKYLFAAALCAVLLTGCGAAPVQEGSAAGSASAESAQSETVEKIPADGLEAFGGCEALSLPGNLASAAATDGDFEDTSALTSFYGTSEEAWQRLLDGGLDVVLTYAPDSETEAKLKEQGVTLQPVGSDALVLLAGSTEESSVTLAREEIAAAYQDSPESWKGYASAPGTDSRKLFAQLFGADSAGVQVKDGEDTLTAACPHTAGTLCYTTYLEMQENGIPQGTSVVQVDGVLPSAQTLTEVTSSVAYPLRAQYYLAVRSGLEENDPAMMFYRWLTSEDGMDWLAQAVDTPAVGETEDTVDNTQSADEAGSDES